MTARNVSPGTRVHFAAVSLAAGDYVIQVVKPAGSVIANADGEARFVSEQETRAVWLVVNGATGGYTVASPTGMLLREMDYPGRGWADNPKQAVRRLVLTRFNVDVFLVRPGTGIWSGNFRDGAANDGDQATNGETDADAVVLQPLNGAPPLERIEPRDIVMFVDRTTLEFHVAKRGE